VSRDPLGGGLPISDEDEWGEKIQLGHSMVGTCECKDVATLSSLERVSVEFHCKRIGQIQDSSQPSILNLANILRVNLGETGLVCVSTGNSSHDFSRHLPVDEWTHIAVTVDRGSLVVYWNGISVLSTTESNSMNLKPPYSISVGSKFTEITEVRVWSTTRTEEQLKEFMHHPLPKLASFSKWKGFRIKTGVSMGPGPVRLKAIALPNIPLERRNQMRRSEEVLKQTTAKESVLSSRSENVQRDTLTSPTEDRMHPVIKACPELQETVQHLITSDILISNQPFSMHAPGACTLPSLNDMKLEDVLGVFDSYLEDVFLQFRSSTLEGKCGREFRKIASQISEYMRAHYRFGPFLAPLPDEELLNRLRVSCEYSGICAVIENGHTMVNTLRIPMLPDDTDRLVMEAIHVAREREDFVCESSLIRTYLPTLSERPVEFESLRNRLQQIQNTEYNKSTNIRCPSCWAPLLDPLQPYCLPGCRSGITVCYQSGLLESTSNCVRCVICRSVTRVGTKPTRLSGNVKAVNKTDLSSRCAFCSCVGSLKAFSN
jgi:hypothetical protein